MKGGQNIKKELRIVGASEEMSVRLEELISNEFPGFILNLENESETSSLSNKDSGNTHQLDEYLEQHDTVLKNSEKYQFLFNNTSNAIFLVDISSGKYIDANNAALKLTGRSLYELQNLTTADVTMKGAVDRIERLILKNEIKEELVEYQRPDGSFRIARLSVIHFKDQLYFGIAQDVTDLIDTQMENKEQGRIYKNLVNNVPGFVYQCKNDSDWTMIFMSNSCIEVTGYKPEELINNKVLSYNELILSDYRKLVWDKMQYAIEHKQRFEFQYPLKHKNGNVSWVSEKAIGVYDNNGNLNHIEGFVSDITDEIRFENIQKTLFKISSSVIKTKDMGALMSKIKTELGNIIDTTNFYIALYDKENDTFSLPFIADQKDEITEFPAGKTMTKYVVVNEKSLLADVETKRKLVEQDLLEFKGTLSKVWLGVPLKVSGEIIGVLAVQSYEDENAYTESDMKLLEFVSDQIGLSIQIKRKEEELKEALQKAEEADRLKTSFLANMSHEIRTPMNGILGFTQVLREDDLTSDEREHFLNIIEKSGNRMLNIINDLIDVSKVDAGLMDVNINGIDLFEVANFLYTFFKKEVSDKGLSLELVHASEKESLFIQTDGEKLYAILTNLIKNAIKYSEKGTISFGYQEKGNEIEFFVKDTGIGIPEDKKKDVFSRFVQLNNSTDPFTEGSGLGLSITKAYVEMLGGKIWFESKQNKGTEFKFTIPNES